MNKKTSFRNNIKNRKESSNVIQIKKQKKS